MQNIIMERCMQSKILNEAFITGCDSNTEWMLPWFIENFKKYNQSKLLVYDFGMTPEMCTQVELVADGVYNLSFIHERGWFKKPKAMLSSPSIKTIWLDTDIQILDNIDNLFSKLVLNKLSMVEDKPWTMRRGEVWHNSGLVGFINKPDILKAWAQQVEKNPQVGDQEVLHSMLDPFSKMTYINDIPNEYNVLRLQTEIDNYQGPIKAMHWTGRKGKEKIRSLINE